MASGPMSVSDPVADLESAFVLRLAPFAVPIHEEGASDDDVSLTVAARRIAREIDELVGAARVTSVELDWEGPSRRLSLVVVVPGIANDRVSSVALEGELERTLGFPLGIDVAPEVLGVPHIEPERRAGPSAARALLRLLTRARARERGAELSVRDEEVHQLRVGFRRMRGTARMLRSAFADDVRARFERAMEVARLAMRRAGAVRDLDVLLDDLKWAEKRAASPDESTGAIREALQSKRELALRPMRRYLTSKSYEAGVRRLEQLLAAVASDETGAGRSAASFARKRLSKEQARCRTALETLDVRNLEQAHAIRVAAKRMRYCAELCAGVVERAERISLAAADVQSVLGRERDATRAMQTIDAILRSDAIRVTPAIVAMTAALAMRRHDATASVRWALAALKDALE